jgi:hypothetical protein
MRLCPYNRQGLLCGLVVLADRFVEVLTGRESTRAKDIKYALNGVDGLCRDDIRSCRSNLLETPR